MEAESHQEAIAVNQVREGGAWIKVESEGDKGLDVRCVLKDKLKRVMMQTRSGTVRHYLLLD